MAPRLVIDIDNRYGIADAAIDAIIDTRYLPELLERTPTARSGDALIRFSNTYRDPRCRPLADIAALSQSGADDSTAPSSAPPAVGRRCHHVKFGRGTVTRIAGAGERAKVTVDFDRLGQKTILARFLQMVPDPGP